ncbi:Uncharacterised protein [Enterobacter hormaechei]|nr:Uncharacterised protein [Enterobacter hormaechei]
MDFSMVNLVCKLKRLFHQFLVQRIVIILFAGQIDRHDGFPALRPRLIFHHPYRTRAFAQQVPVCWSENHGFQFVMLVRHFQQQVMPTGHHFLNNGFEGAVVPDYFNINRYARFQVILRLLADPRGTLADHSLTHSGALVRRQKGGHLV